MFGFVERDSLKDGDADADCEYSRYCIEPTATLEAHKSEWDQNNPYQYGEPAHEAIGFQSIRPDFGVWVGIGVFMLARLLVMAWRWQSGSWAPDEA